MNAERKTRVVHFVKKHGIGVNLGIAINTYGGMWGVTTPSITRVTQKGTRFVNPCPSISAKGIYYSRSKKLSARVMYRINCVNRADYGVIGLVSCPLHTD